jgi:hypothetical protein
MEAPCLRLSFLAQEDARQQLSCGERSLLCSVIQLTFFRMGMPKNEGEADRSSSNNIAWPSGRWVVKSGLWNLFRKRTGLNAVYRRVFAILHWIQGQSMPLRCLVPCQDFQGMDIPKILAWLRNSGSVPDYRLGCLQGYFVRMKSESFRMEKLPIARPFVLLNCPCLWRFWVADLLKAGR